MIAVIATSLQGRHQAKQLLFCEAAVRACHSVRACLQLAIVLLLECAVRRVSWACLAVVSHSRRGEVRRCGRGSRSDVGVLRGRRRESGSHCLEDDGRGCHVAGAGLWMHVALSGWLDGGSLARAGSRAF